MSAKDEGIYSCAVGNPDVQHIQLHSNPIGIFIDYDKRSTHEQDSLAMVKLYHATNGENWTRNDHWLVGPLNTWYGIGARKAWGAPDDKPRVQQVHLANNNLEGELPGEVRNLTFIEQFDVSRNRLVGTIPAINTAYPHDSLAFENNYFTDMSSAINSLPSIYIIAHNKLTFEDILPLLAKDSIHFSGDNVWYRHVWSYQQRSVGKDTVVVVKENEDFVIDLGIDLAVTDNDYIWFKDSTAIDTTTVSSYTLKAATIDDSGTYTCQITNSNPKAKGIVLSSYSVEIRVDPYSTRRFWVRV